MAARRAGISGVPFFIFNRKVAISGAHEPETLLEAMAQAGRGRDAIWRPCRALAVRFCGSL